MKYFYCVLFIVFLITSGGCAGRAVEGIDAITGAGITSIKSEPIIAEPGKVIVGHKIDLSFGKDYSSIKFEVVIDPETKKIIKVLVDARGVVGSASQESIADAIVQIQKDLSAAGVEITGAITKAITTGVTGAIIPSIPITNE